jgi:hypothetical protein
LRTFGHFIKHWVNGVRLITGAYVCLTLKHFFFSFFFLKAFRKFPRHRKEKLGINEACQNDFISKIRGTVKILLCFTINPNAQTQNSPLLKVRENLAI